MKVKENIPALLVNILYYLPEDHLLNRILQLLRFRIQSMSEIVNIVKKTLMPY